MHDNQGRAGKRGGRVASQSLSEATWLITVLQGADLVWNSLTPEERSSIETNLVRPALDEIIIPQKLGIHNIQCRQNSAIGLAGFLLGDAKLIAQAIDDPKIGFRQQLAKGVDADGLWLEGSSGYHFFTIEGLWPLAEAARLCGVNLYDAKFKSMFDGPFALAMPNLVLPNFNDSGYSALPERAPSYELALARFHDAKYTALLGRRNNRMALLFGVVNPPAHEDIAALPSRNLAAGGYAILQQGPGTQATWLNLKYGPHGGGHGHPDKNSFVLYARGQVVAPDAGTHAYGSPLHAGWDKTTLAHNTLVVDEKSQTPAQGKCLAFGQTNGVEFAMTEAGAIYPDDNIRFIRTVAMLSSNVIIFVDQITAAAPHTYDLAYHQAGVWDELPAGTPWKASTTPGYRYFTQTTSRPNAGLTLTSKTKNSGTLAVTLAGGEAGEVITGYGILTTTEDLVPLVMQRRHAQNTVFVWAISLDGSPVKLDLADVNSDSGSRLDRASALMVQVKIGGQQRRLLVNPHEQAVSAAQPDGTVWSSRAAFSVR